MKKMLAVCLGGMLLLTGGSVQMPASAVQAAVIEAEPEQELCGLAFDLPAQTLKVGETRQVRAVWDGDSYLSNPVIQSENNDIALVFKDGQLFAQKAGTVTLYIRAMLNPEIVELPPGDSGERKITTTVTVTDITEPLTDAQKAELERFTQWKETWGDRFPRAEAVIKGLCAQDAPRLTLDAVHSSIAEADSFTDIFREITDAAPFPDYYGGSGATVIEYWFDDMGTEKIYVIPDILPEPEIIYSRCDVYGTCKESRCLYPAARAGETVNPNAPDHTYIQFHGIDYYVPSGNINGDGGFNTADAVLLQKWLLGDPDAQIEQPKMADFIRDGQLNAADLTLMKLKETYMNLITVSDVEGIFTAVRSAKPGDTIQIQPGIYDFTTYQGAQKIDTAAAGTADAPITLSAADPNNPPVLTGNTTANGYVLHIQGDWWILDHLKCTTAQKGIVLDHSSHSVIRYCEVENTGAEAIALRDGSSECTVYACQIHDTGKVSPGYGEGVYIGSAVSTTGFDYKCDNNKVLNCTFRNVAAEHIDIQEFTTGTEIANCTFYGDGMTGENYAGSFIDIAGNDCYVHNNMGYRNENPNIVAAFEIHEQAEGWGYHHRFEHNSVNLDREYSEQDPSRPMYVVDGWFSDITVRNNLVWSGDEWIRTGPAHYNVASIEFK